MDALLFAFLLTLALDQGDRPQSLALALASRLAPRRRTAADDGLDASPVDAPPLTLLIVAIVAAIVVIASLALAAVGVLIGRGLNALARSLFLGMAILLGASGFLLPQRAGLPSRGMLGSAPALAVRLLIARLYNRSGFGLLGLATFSGDPTGVAAGGIIAGFLSTLLPMLVGPAYLAFFARPLLRWMLGIALMLVAVPLALIALGLL